MLHAQSTPPSSTQQQPDDLWSAYFQALDALGPTINSLETSTSSTAQSSGDLQASSQASEQLTQQETALTAQGQQTTAALQASSSTLQSQQGQASQVLTQQQNSIASSSESASSSIQSITAVQADLTLADAAVKRLELENVVLKVAAGILAALATGLGVWAAVK
jgi:hypothetical protein